MVLCPEVSMTTFCGTPARIRLRIAERRKSWTIKPRYRLLTVREFPCAENPAERGKLLGAAAIGAGGATAVAGGAEAAAAIKAMAEAHPYATKLVKAAIKAGVGAEAYKHRGWLLDLLP